MYDATLCRRCSNAQETRTEYALQAFSNPTDGLKAAWQKIAAWQDLVCPKCNRERGIPSTDTFCEACAKLLPLRYFSQEKQELWKMKSNADLCARDAKANARRPKRCIVQVTTANVNG